MLKKKFFLMMGQSATPPRSSARDDDHARPPTPAPAHTTRRKPHAAVQPCVRSKTTTKIDDDDDDLDSTIRTLTSRARQHFSDRLREEKLLARRVATPAHTTRKKHMAPVQPRVRSKAASYYEDRRRPVCVLDHQDFSGRLREEKLLARRVAARNNSDSGSKRGSENPRQPSLPRSVLKPQSSQKRKLPKGRPQFCSSQPHHSARVVRQECKAVLLQAAKQLV